MTEISIPYQWEPRPHQIPFFKAMDSGAKRACIVWHRRAGKGAATLNFTAKEMFKRVGTYWHSVPSANASEESHLERHRQRRPPNPRTSIPTGHTQAHELSGDADRAG
jgi:hypothetical protein